MEKANFTFHTIPQSIATKTATTEVWSTTEKTYSSAHDQPFKRPRTNSDENQDDKGESRLRAELTKALHSLNEHATLDEPLDVFVRKALEILANRWRKRDGFSELSLQGLLLVLEYCLQHSMQSHKYFEDFIAVLGYQTVTFWKNAVPYIFESDMSFGTKYRDALLFCLTLYDVNNGRNRLRELYAAVPGIRKSLLGFHAKQFGERFHHLQLRHSRPTSRTSSIRGSLEDLNIVDVENDAIDLSRSLPAASFIEQQFSPRTRPVLEENSERREGGNGSLRLGPKRKRNPLFVAVSEACEMGVGGGILKRSNSAGHDISKSPETSVFSVGGLASTHFSKRVINVSNAPPVSLKKTGSGEWEIKQGSGGLVSCVDPVMSKDFDNMWLANLGVNLRNQPSSPSSRQQDWAGRRSTESPHQMAPATNSLGLPLIRQAGADVLFHVLEDDSKFEELDPKKRTARDEMSLLGVLHNYNRGNYKLNPVIVTEEDYNVYYGGISNGLLWPALHNLPEYIVKDYDDIKVLQDHWHAYVRVNYQFAINAVRNSRPQDFIWIHDYHLLLTGMIMQSLDQHLEVGFFLHIPFQPPANFFEKYGQVGTAVLRGILRFTKVGFQTHRDRAKFVELVEEHLGAAKVKYDAEVDIYTITHEGWMCSLGVFPVSIKNEDFLSIAYNPDTIKRGEDIRKRVMSKSLPDGKLFFSVERFDYTKGIKEKLLAYWHYFEQHPDRLGKDVLFQIAVMNRRSVDTYRQYQDECIELAEKINGAFSCPEAPEWKPLIFQTDGLPRSDLVAHYLAMDLGLVTPKKDGMNLVAKEMLVCNPRAGLILSTGAGSEIQFSTAGLFQKDGEQCYKQINDVYDVKSYAEAFYAAATEPTATRIAHGKRLHKFILAHDIERWSTAFLDPSWTHEVIRPTDVRTLDDFYNLMMRTRNVRRQIVERVLKGIPIRPHFSVSLRNAKESLALSCKHKTKNIVLRTTGDPDSKLVAHFDIQNELEELDKDLNFLEFVQSDEVNNVEQFVETLKIYHPVSPEEFKAEVQPAIDLLYKGDHFHFFFTDRDGTLKSYSCSYPASIQPAYSGVIQAQFARRCAQTCAILTTAPLMHIGILDVGTIPEGYYYYGASAGREWFIDPSKKFKDNSIPEADIALLDQVFSRVAELLDTPEYKHFTWIGSGLQKHCGHLTIAHQDIHGSVDRKQSRNLHDKVCQITIEVDPLGETLTVSESETDIKVFLKAKLSGMIFNKGHGIKLLCEQMQLDLREGNVLVCGDSETDLPMLEQCLAAHPAAVYTIWVTRNEALKRKVTALCDAYDNVNVAFVSCPEVLLGAMAQATIREIKMRPRPPPSESSDEDNSVPQSPVV